MADDDLTTLRPSNGDPEPDRHPFFEVASGARQGERLALRRGASIIGKGHDVEIRLAESGVSRRHARVDVDAVGKVVVTDLDSTNGTYVGKQRVESYALARGDRISFGPDAVVRLVYLERGAAERTATLSARQLQLARLVATGMTSAEIADKLGISPRTVTSHLDHIYARLDIRSRSALTRWVLERGLGLA
ncbi:MAG: FHA domain-containing protein [Nannocystaceae bacterium]|nr:FHA domain-containing protein [Nannocystaceae bacterium]